MKLMIQSTLFFFGGGGGNSIEKKNRISSSLTISADQLVKQNI